MRPMWLSDCGGMCDFKDLEIEIEGNGNDGCRFDVNECLFLGIYWIIYFDTHTHKTTKESLV